MYQNKKVLAIIPARKGSTRIKNKNLCKIFGKTLVEYSIDIAKKSKYIDDILVSTDSSEIANIAESRGCIFNGKRPKDLSGDCARVIDMLIYEISRLNKKYDAVVVLQPTYPYRTIKMLDGAIEKYFITQTSLITVVEATEQPIFMRKITNGKLEKILTQSSDIRSQDFNTYYKIIGSIYINNTKDLKTNTILNENETPYIVDQVFNIDINYPEDLKRAEVVLQKTIKVDNI